MSGADKKARARLSGGLFSSLTRYLRGRRGAVAPLLALSLIPIIGAMGMGAEASNWWLTQRSVQNAADTAALAAAINGGTADSGGSTVPTAATSCTTGANAANWYCEAIAAAAKMGYSVSTTVAVTPTTTTSPTTPCSTYKCYKVTVSKKVPIFLLSVVGFRGDSTIGSTHYQTVSASAIADQPGPPVDFCMLTTNGDFQTNGGKTADLLGCSTFANGNSNCNGHGDGIAYDYASGSASCPAPDVNRPTQSAQCDPYGGTSQTLGGVATSCPNGHNLTSYIPSDTGCTNSSTTGGTAGAFNAATAGGHNSSAYPSDHLITQAALTAALAANPTAPVIKVCGNAALAGPGTVTTSGNGNNQTNTLPACTSNIAYSGGVNIKIVIYNGTLDTNGCELVTASTGGMTLIFAPNYTAGGAINGTCSTLCVPSSSWSGHSNCTSSGSGADCLDIAAPTPAVAGSTAFDTSNPFAGVAIVQSASFTGNSSACNGGGGGSSLDWCAAGNAPTLALQGAMYMPNANLGFSGAISKFTGIGALNCIGIVSKSMYVNGTGSLFNNFTAGLTADCSSAGWFPPSIQGTHSYAAQLVG